jgi:hypothetical protein
MEWHKMRIRHVLRARAWDLVDVSLVLIMTVCGIFSLVR